MIAFAAVWCEFAEKMFYRLIRSGPLEQAEMIDGYLLSMFGGANCKK